VTVDSAPRSILFVSQPADAGVPAHVLDLVMTLDRDQWTPTVACPPASSLWRALDGRGDVTLVPIGDQTLPRPSDLRDIARLVPLVRRSYVVHAHSSKAGFVARLAGLAARRPGRIVYTPHGWSYWAFDGMVAKAFVGVEAVLSRCCGAVICLSEYERTDAVQRRVLRPAKARMIRNGIDSARFSHPRTPVPGRIVMVARFASQKRHALAVEALACLVAVRPVGDDTAAELWFVGDGPLRAEIELLADSLGVADRVRFLGRRDDVPQILASAACVLLATAYEACPLSVLEAMMAGVPVVATRVGGMEELLDEECGVVVDSTPRALADALARLLDDPDAAERMGKVARERALAEFELRTCVRHTVEVYEQLGGRR
jgi:glycosyltransferase involved in cell wall biosynthesis